MNRSTAVNVQTFLNEQPFSPFQWLIFFMCFVIVLLDGFDTAAIGFIAPSLIVQWGITKPALAPVLSAALFGLACGALGSGPLSDRLGRRSMLLGSVLLFGVACLGSAFSNSIEQLTVLRFITGVGLGAAMPNAVTMMGEYCPDRRRATLINLMFCGFPLGAAFGGFLAAWMIPHFGWRSVLVLGGVAPLLLLIVLVLQMPESVRYMVANNKPVERIRAALARISSEAAQAGTFVMTETAPDFVVVGETRNYSFEAITKAIRLINGGARFIVTNPDATGPSAEGSLPATGAVAALVTKATGVEPYFVGKPNPLMMREALRAIDAHSESTAMIGDRMDTDVIAGMEAGMRTILVLSGITTRDLAERFPYRPSRIVNSVADLAAELVAERREVGASA